MEYALNINSRINDEGWVVLAYTGDFFHPLAKKKVSLTAEKLKSWVNYFSYLKEKGNTIPLVPNHSVDPLQRLGTLIDAKFEDGKFMGKLEYSRKEDAEKLKDASFSPWFKDEFTESDEKQFQSVLLHVGVTDYPVIKGLKTAIAASSIFSGIDLQEAGIITSNEGDDSMPFPKNVLEELGLAEDAKDENVLAAIKALKENQNVVDEEEDDEDENDDHQLSTAEKLVQKFTDKIKKERLSALDALKAPKEIKERLKKHIDDVESDIFEDMLSLVPQQDESFHTGPQDIDAEDQFSLVSQMKERAKAAKGEFN